MGSNPILGILFSQVFKHILPFYKPEACDIYQKHAFFFPEKYARLPFKVLKSVYAHSKSVKRKKIDFAFSFYACFLRHKSKKNGSLLSAISLNRRAKDMHDSGMQ